MVLQIRITTTLFLSSFFLILFSLSATSAVSGTSITIDADMQYAYALERFDQKDFQTATVELNRFIYFFPDDKRVRAAKFKKGLSLFHTKRYGEAIPLFRELAEPLSGGSVDGVSLNSSSANGDPVVVEALFMLSTTLLAIKRDGSAEMVLQNLLLLNDDEQIEDRALYALVLICLARAGDGKNRRSEKEASLALADALKYIERISTSGRKRYRTEIVKEHIVKTAQTVQREKRSPVVAAIASVIPGGGFAYCNRYQDALVAFLLNSAFALAAVESFEDGNGALGGLICFVGSGFYGGSIYGGISSAHKYNNAIIRRGVDEIRRDPELKQDISPLSYHQIPVIDDDEHRKESGDKIPLISVKIPF